MMHGASNSFYKLLVSSCGPKQGAARFKEMDRISAMVKQLEETEKLAAKMGMDINTSTK